MVEIKTDLQSKLSELQNRLATDISAIPNQHSTLSYNELVKKMCETLSSIVQFGEKIADKNNSAQQEKLYKAFDSLQKLASEADRKMAERRYKLHDGIKLAHKMKLKVSGGTDVVTEEQDQTDYYKLKQYTDKIFTLNTEIFLGGTRNLDPSDPNFWSFI